MGDDSRLVVVSNRLPALTPPSSEEARREAPVGGLVSALKGALERRGGLWVGWSGETRVGSLSTEPKISEVGKIELAAVDLPRSDFNLFYNFFANRTLWPVLHSFPGKTMIRHDAFRAYIRINRKYAEAVASRLRDDDVVWVHDFHLIPLGSELRRLGWKGKVGFFLHTPFPPEESFSVLPSSPELLEMMMDYDLMGLHTRRYANNLVHSLSSELDGTHIGDTLRTRDKSLRIRVYPIGIDVEGFERLARQPGMSPEGEYMRDGAPDHKIILGVDRLDYTKGITHRLLTFERLLERHPRLHGKMSLIQISAPSRTRVPEYVEEREHVDQLVGRINGRYTEAGWVPVHYLYRSIPQDQLVCYYREANVCLVTPLRDGMNLVAKEFVASQDDDPGVVVLSKFCGAAETMRDALIVNPHDISGTAETIFTALNMPQRERVLRRDALMEHVRTFTSHWWSDTFLEELAES